MKRSASEKLRARVNRAWRDSDREVDCKANLPTDPLREDEIELEIILDSRALAPKLQWSLTAEQLLEHISSVRRALRRHRRCQLRSLDSHFSGVLRRSHG